MRCERTSCEEGRGNVIFAAVWHDQDCIRPFDAERFLSNFLLTFIRLQSSKTFLPRRQYSPNFASESSVSSDFNLQGIQRNHTTLSTQKHPRYHSIVSSLFTTASASNSQQPLHLPVYVCFIFRLTFPWRLSARAVPYTSTLLSVLVKRQNQSTSVRLINVTEGRLLRSASSCISGVCHGLCSPYIPCFRRVMSCIYM